MQVESLDNKTATVPLPRQSSAKASKRPLRIMHVVSSLGRGGAELGILKLVSGLDPEIFEHRLCATRDFDPDFVHAFQLDSVFNVAGRSDSTFQFPFFRLKKLFERHRPDIVHTRNWGALEAVPAARRAGVPVIIHSEHGYEVDMLKGMQLRRRLFRHFAYAMTDAVFAVTRELRDYHALQAWISPERIGVMYNGVDTERFSASPEKRNRVRNELCISSSTFVIGSVGRLVAIKDYRTLLRAAEIIAQRGKDIRVVLVGEGREREILEAQVRSSAELSGRVTLAGASDSVPDLLNAMDVYVLSSLREGMSNTLLEAMSTSLPIVATRMGGNPEAIEEQRSGFFFFPGDVVHLADLLERLCSDTELRKRLGAASRDRAVAEFSLRQMLQRYHALYLEQAQRRGLAGTSLKATNSRS